MSGKAKYSVVLALVGLALVVSTGSPVGAASRPATAASHANEVESILYSQLDNPGGSYTSQNFEAVYDAYDSFAADDFLVPANTTWTIKGIGVNGSVTLVNQPASFNVSFYVDNGGLPLDPAKATQTLSYQLVNGTYRIPLNPAPKIPGGPNGRHLWVSVQANMNFLPAGDQWFWTSRTVQSNSAAAWKNPGGGFGVGCVVWAPLAGCLSAPEPDLGFVLIGVVSK
jgi:hypothetical protein